MRFGRFFPSTQQTCWRFVHRLRELLGGRALMEKKILHRSCLDSICRSHGFHLRTCYDSCFAAFLYSASEESGEACHRRMPHMFSIGFICTSVFFGCCSQNSQLYVPLGHSFDLRLKQTPSVQWHEWYLF